MFTKVILDGPAGDRPGIARGSGRKPKIRVDRFNQEHATDDPAHSQFRPQRRRPTAVEYAVMVALIAVAIIATVQALGTTMNSKFGEVSTKIGGV